MTDWENIPGAGGNSYTPAAADQSHCILVTAIYNDKAGIGRTEQFLTTESVEFGPFFDADTGTASVAENSPEDHSIHQFRARHSNSVEVLTYSFGSPEPTHFTVDSATGQLRTSASPLDYETQPGLEAEVEITATNSNSETATITVTISVIDECETVGESPCAPSVSPASTTSLKVTWQVPAAESHDLQYREAASSISWTPISGLGAGRSYTITGLTTGTEYEVQVRTANGGNPGDWSPPGTGIPRTPPPTRTPAPPTPTPTSPSGSGGGGSGSGGGRGGFAFRGGGGGGAAAPQPRQVTKFQSPQLLFQPMIDTGDAAETLAADRPGPALAALRPQPEGRPSGAG